LGARVRESIYNTDSIDGMDLQKPVCRSALTEFGLCT